MTAQLPTPHRYELTWSRNLADEGRALGACRYAVARLTGWRHPGWVLADSYGGQLDVHLGQFGELKPLEQPALAQAWAGVGIGMDLQEKVVVTWHEDKGVPAWVGRRWFATAWPQTTVTELAAALRRLDFVVDALEAPFATAEPAAREAGALLEDANSALFRRDWDTAAHRVLDFLGHPGRRQLVSNGAIRTGVAS